MKAVQKAGGDGVKALPGEPESPAEAARAAAGARSLGPGGAPQPLGAGGAVPPRRAQGWLLPACGRKRARYVHGQGRKHPARSRLPKAGDEC